ncbi:hypothetical protein SAMN06265346_10273 [Flavobacterium hercynium]|nr:hypothetical protein SAMN06265346_10273 [Flavobacterium hercynium]
MLTFCLSLFSCKTYTINPENFKQQFENIEYDQSTSAITGPIHYNGFQIKTLKVKDKEGNTQILENKPSLEMRVTLNNGKRKHFYFDSIKFINDTLIGHKSRFLPKMITKIPYNEISKIEIQDGGKNFKYKN